VANLVKRAVEAKGRPAGPISGIAIQSSRICPDGRTESPRESGNPQSPEAVIRMGRGWFEGANAAPFPALMRRLIDSALTGIDVRF